MEAESGERGSAAFDFTLNGHRVRVEGISPNSTLLEFLRETGRTGAKEGCAEGDCGACSVAVIEADAQGRRTYRAINSCLIPVCLLAGREVISVEGVACGGKLHPVQQKMVEGHGSQCGYCTPGFVISMFEGYYRDDLATRDQLEDQLCGNLCRCTGYRSIGEAAIEALAERASTAGADRFAVALAGAAEKPGPIEYEWSAERFFRPASMAELFAITDSHPAARLIAGATELALDITKRFKKFPTLVSLEAIPELHGINRTGSAWCIGAAATLTDIEDRLGAEFPVMKDMLRVFGSRQIRNRATMGGNLVTASPIGDSAPVLLAHDAELVLASRSGERVLPISEFFTSYRKTALQPGEILKSIVIPRGAAVPGCTRVSRWLKVSRRREMDISTVAGCFVVELDSTNTVRHARLAYGGVAARPARAEQTEAVLIGRTWSAATIHEALPRLRTEFKPISDTRGSAEYRSALIESLFEKFFREAALGTCLECTEPKGGTSNPSAPAGDSPSGMSACVSREMPTNHSGFATVPSGASPGGTGQWPVLPHESAHKHVTGEAIYTDDQTAGFLETWPVCSPCARARILKRDATAARVMPGIKAVLLAEDVPGLNDTGTKHDEPLFADTEVLFHGQIVALVVGETADACRVAAEKVVVEYEPLPPVLTLRQALAARSFHNEPNFIRRGNADEELANAPLTLEGEFELGGQDHFYLESHAAWAERGEDGAVLVTSSTQHPSEVQQAVAHVLRVPANKVVVQCLRLGGGFGGKETQAAIPAALAALAAHQTGQPVRVRFNRDQDMIITGHRHPFLARFKVGFGTDGTLRAD